MQSRKMSFLEQCVATTAGLGIALLALPALGAIAGVPVNHTQNFIITGGMTVISVVRGYFVRRFFNWWHHRPAKF